MYARQLKKALCCAAASSALIVAGGALSPSMAQIEEIVVTAQKRAQSLQDVPITVSAVSAETIEVAGIDTIQDVQKLVPGLHVYRAFPAMTSIVVRGAGTGASDPTLEPSVGLFIDGVYMPRSMFGFSDLVDVERVEVLMGPQGTLYGRNTNAGVISVTSKGMPDDFEGQLELTAGDYSLTQVNAAFGARLSDKLGVRLSAVDRKRDGILENELPGGEELNAIDSRSIRGQLFWNPTDTTSFRAIGYNSVSDSNAGTPESSFEPTSAFYLGLIAPLSGVAGIPLPETDGQDRRVQRDVANHSRFEVEGASLQIDHDIANGVTFTSISAWQEWSISDTQADSDSTGLSLVTTSLPAREETFSQELRLTSPGDETLDWMLGAFYFDSKMQTGSSDGLYAEYPSGLPFPTPAALFGPLATFYPTLSVAGDNNIWNSNFDSNSWAVFGQGTYKLEENTSLTLGVRYADEDKSFDMSVTSHDAAGVQFTPANLHPLLTGGLGNGTYAGGLLTPYLVGNLADFGATQREGDRSEGNFTYMASLNHFFGNHMAYATIATGSKSGGFNAAFGSASSDAREFDTEETTNYEVGVKLDGLLDGRARINLSYFYTVYEDFQAATFDPVTVQFLVGNAGEQVTQGMDVDATLLVTDNLTLGARLEYLDAEYTDYTGANCHALSGETVTAEGCVLDGEPLEFASDITASFSVDYVKPLKSGMDFYSRADLSYKGDHIADPTRAPYARDINYTLLDGRIGLRKDNWDISLWGKNLTDETYEHVFSAQFLAGLVGLLAADPASSLNHNAWVNDPRTWGVTARVKF